MTLPRPLLSRTDDRALGRRLVASFGHLFVINLASRADRRREIDAQLGLVGLGLDHPSVTLFEAIRPDGPGEWPSIGARGCFMSHLGVLRAARERGLDRILILEDDVDWTRAFLDRGADLMDALAAGEWQFFHGGHDESDQGEAAREGGRIRPVAPETGLSLTHLIGLGGGAIARAEAYLSTMAERRAGDPSGGPMHVDGAYGWFRRDNPDIVALMAVPAIARQRASRTDIHTLRWIDRVPGIAGLVARARRLKNLIARG